MVAVLHSASAPQSLIIQQCLYNLVCNNCGDKIFQRMRQSLDNPPPYDTNSGHQPSSFQDEKVKPMTGALNARATEPSSQTLFMAVGPPYIPQSQGLPTHTVYRYTNPRTGEQCVSLLPPDYPEMMCLQAGEHVPETKFGLLGILAAVFWFPLGVGLCLLDRRVKCQRCGTLIEDGLCGP